MHTLLVNLPAVTLHNTQSKLSFIHTRLSDHQALYYGLNTENETLIADTLEKVEWTTQAVQDLETSLLESTDITGICLGSSNVSRLSAIFGAQSKQLLNVCTYVTAEGHKINVHTHTHTRTHTPHTGTQFSGVTDE